MKRNYGISIGVNGYKFSSLDPLKYAKADAALVANFLKEDAKFDQVWLFSDDSPKIYNETTIPYRTPLRRFFRNQFEQPFMSKEDSLWLFFSGHGVQYNGADYVLPIDGDLEDPEGSGISLDWIVERLRRSHAGEIILIVDMCRVEGRKGSAPEGSLYNGITTIFSCKPNESSWEIDAPIRQGAFTYVLVQNLKRQINDCPLTIVETERTLQQELVVLNRKYGKQRQTPHIRCESVAKSNSFLFSCVLVQKRGFAKEKGKATSSNLVTQKIKRGRNGRYDVMSLKQAALEAEENKELDLAKSLWEQVLKIDNSEQPSYISAITRIAESALLQSLRFDNPIIQNRLDKPLAYEEDSGNPIKRSPDKISSLKQLPEIQNLGGLKEYRYDYQILSSTDERTSSFHDSTYSLVEKISEVEIEMLVVIGGTFLMGSSEKTPSDSELPQHEVKVKPFLMSKYAITKQQWKAIAQQPQINRALKLRTSLHGSNNHPVVEISWYEATEFCDRLTKASGCEYRLPTEAEWEYACRAGSTTSFHFGNHINKKVAQYDSEHTADVCQFPYPNAFGIYSMHGNVWEWCLDHWHPNYKNAPMDGSAWLDVIENQDRIQRGGSWRNESKLCRSACRVSDCADAKSSSTGFRIVRPLM